MSKKNVAVLLGGISSEREVSLRSGAAIVKALKALGHNVTEIDVGRDAADKIKQAKPDIVFNALHGTYGEDGCIQGLLEIMGIPYTHSGVLASAVAMDKPAAKIMFEKAGIQCAPGEVMTREELANNGVIEPQYVVKPTSDGSSVGVIIIRRGDRLDASKLEEGRYLVEKLIEGKELSVAVLDGKALGVIEIRPKQGFYDYKNKYTSGMTEYIMPAEVDKKTYEAAMKMAEDAHNVLGCRGVSRADIMCDKNDGKLYMLEVNTHPGMTELSLVPKIAAYVGMSFEQVVESLLKSARCDNG